ncbi:MAG: DUF6530 family protein [Gemmatimonadota bacterium]|nr:DUF6530 family protein [Gemmatimonadota bacterium]
MLFKNYKYLKQRNINFNILLMEEKDMNLPNPRYLKHRPVVLLPYAEHDGDDAGNTDCKWISIGFAQWDDQQTTLSVKTLRHTGERWSRQSEELPLHRCLDAALLIAATVAQAAEGARDVSLDAGVLENQQQPIELPIETQGRLDRNEFETKLRGALLLRRLKKLTDTLIALRARGVLNEIEE